MPNTDRKTAVGGGSQEVIAAEEEEEARRLSREQHELAVLVAEVTLSESERSLAASIVKLLGKKSGSYKSR